MRTPQVQRREVGYAVPAQTQRLAFQAVAGGARRDLIQSQADLAQALGDFQDFAGTGA
ncbi:hypothetical protein WDV06_06450 [Streptomyces racemochromogenes]|uniref:Uncharacterized protein n=1 Tax=Streptomyces racemochromogenes TaxID=67353 RepID=A0ABW7P9I2_9ACTN